MRERGSPLRLATWNVHGAARPDARDLARVIDSLDVDVIGLQEVRRHQARRISKSLGLHCVWAFKHNGYSSLLPRLAEGLAILSRWPLPHDGDTELDGPRSPRDFRRRIALWATIEHPDGAFDFVNTHLASGEDADERVRQAAHLARIVSEGLVRECDHHVDRDHRHERGTNSATVVVGDLNDHGEPAVVDTLATDTWIDGWDHAMERSRSGLTNPASAPRQRLDHVLVPNGWTVSRVDVPDASDEWTRRSDHLPVVATVQMRSK